MLTRNLLFHHGIILIFKKFRLCFNRPPNALLPPGYPRPAASCLSAPTEVTIPEVIILLIDAGIHTTLRYGVRPETDMPA